MLLLLPIALLTASCSDDDDTPSAPAPSATGEFMDSRDSTVYHWVRYGNLEWTTENLRYKVTEGSTLPDLTPVNTQFGYYDDGVASKYYAAFGLLYNFEAAKAAVPDGWRLPTQSDWENLAMAVNGDIKDAIGLSLSGYMLHDDFFQQLHNVLGYAYVYGFYWTADTDPSKSGDNFAFYRKITYNKSGYTTESTNKANFLSVRLVRNAQ